MCLGIPMRLTAVEGIAGRTEGGVLVDLSLLPEARAGDWVLSFLGTGREVLTPPQAARISSALQGLAALMAGGGLGDAFADLDGRTPPLPPHLQAAMDVGRTTG